MGTGRMFWNDSLFFEENDHEYDDGQLRRIILRVDLSEA
jgi:hypothetical protein